MNNSTPAPLLIIGYGNPSRGDDALGPSALDRIDCQIAQHPEWVGIELLTDFQLQIECVTDLHQRERVIFIDAAVQTGIDTALGFSFGPLVERQNIHFTSHALSPASLLGVYRQHYQSEPPACFMLAIFGYEFELGGALSKAAQSNLDAAILMLEHWISANCCAQPCYA